jgi:oxygen-independent coproporphyrinogen-3 oxidase
MNLRRTRGVDFDDFLRHTGFDARRLFREELDRFATEGLVEVGSDSVRFTRRGLMVADSILSELV